MNRSEYDRLNDTKAEPTVITGDQLINRGSRTLIFGYTLERQDFHVYFGHDGHIHILVYRRLHSEGETPSFLVLSHHGPGGEPISSNHDFLPSKRAYPESCDLEFCQLLRKEDERPSFTVFTDEADERRKREHDGFAGFTADHPGAIAGVSLGSCLHAHPCYPANDAQTYYALGGRLLMQAAQDLGVPADVLPNSQAIVAKPGSVEVYARACTYLEGIQEFDIQNESFVEQLGLEVFGRYLGGNIVNRTIDLTHGLLSVELETHGIPFVENKAFQRYEGKGEYSLSAVTGDYEGKMFFATHLSSGITQLEYLQFGDRERFLARRLRRHNLRPAETANA